MSYDYEQKLKHPKWQKKRLEVLERADWKCQVCGDKEETLHVHHLVYSKGEPWDAPMETLECLCGTCHENREQFNDFFDCRTTRPSAYCNLFRFYFGLAERGDWGDEGKKLVHEFMLKARVVREKVLRTELPNETPGNYAARMVEVDKLFAPPKRRPFIPPIETPRVIEDITSAIKT